MPSWTKQVFSYILSFAVYSLLLGGNQHACQVAFILLGGIAFHEGGHLYAAKRLGMKTKGFYLFPFMGGMSLIADRYRKYTDQAVVVLAGPLAGAMLTVLCYVAYLLSGSELLGSACYWMAWVNLFNLLPMAMLDGGQFMESVVFSLSERLGLIITFISYIVAVIILWHINIILVGLVVFTGWNKLNQLWQNYNIKQVEPDFPGLDSPEKMSIGQIVISVLAYGGIVGGLLSMLLLFHNNSLNMMGLFGK